MVLIGTFDLLELKQQFLCCPALLGHAAREASFLGWHQYAFETRLLGKSKCVMGGRLLTCFCCKTVSFDVNAEPYRCSKRRRVSVRLIAKKPACISCLTSASPVVIRLACIRHNLRCMSCLDRCHGQHYKEQAGH